MLAFVEWLGQPRAAGGGGGGGGGGKGDGGAPSLRDLLAWTSFTAATVATLGAPAAYLTLALTLTLALALVLVLTLSRPYPVLLLRL